MSTYHLSPYMQSVDELAHRQIAANCRNNITGAVRYARKKDFTEKHRARSTILSMLTKERYPDGLNILTMPGLSWEFENRLLSLRESGWVYKNKPVKRTFITGVEIDPAVYRAGCLQMPRGDETPFVSIQSSPMWTAHTIASNCVKAFHNCDVYRLMRECDSMWNVAWLDFIGPLSRCKIEQIRDFYESKVDGSIIVTCLAARHSQETSIELENYGELEGWFESMLLGRVEHCFRYCDGASPMIQFAVSKI